MDTHYKCITRFKISFETLTYFKSSRAISPQLKMFFIFNIFIYYERSESSMREDPFLCKSSPLVLHKAKHFSWYWIYKQIINKHWSTSVSRSCPAVCGSSGWRWSSSGGRTLPSPGAETWNMNKIKRYMYTYKHTYVPFSIEEIECSLFSILYYVIFIGTVKQLCHLLKVLLTLLFASDEGSKLILTPLYFVF